MSARARLRALLDHPWTQRTVITVILVNAITIGCETSERLMAEAGGLLHAVDRAALVIFVVELAARLYAHGRAFFRDPWNWFDTLIVAIALVPASSSTSVLRVLRVLRALRLVSAVPGMRRVVNALLRAVPGMASIIGLFLLLVYVAGVISTKLFGGLVPERFGDLPRSLFTLFQIMTGDDWGNMAQEVMERQPWAWVFFIVYILMSTFVALNLFIAVVVNAMTETGPETAPAEAAALRAELAVVHAKLDQLLAKTQEPAAAPELSRTPERTTETSSR